MSNALRLFIRESLTNEAVGQVTWIKKDYTLTTSTKDGSATSAIVKWLGGKLGGGWGVTKAAAGRAARTRTGKVVGISGLSLAVGWITNWLSDSKPGATDEDKTKAADEKLGAFEEAIKTIISNNQEAIITAFRTPSITAGLTANADAAAMTPVIDGYIENYKKHTGDIIAAANKDYDAFFTKIPAYNVCKNALDAEINKAAASDPKATTSFKSFALDFLVYSAISFSVNTDATDPISASGKDLSDLLSANFIQDNSADPDRYGNYKRIQDASAEISNRLNSDSKCKAIITQF